MSLDTAEIRRGTRVALPASDGYLFRLGVALYGFAYVNSFLTEIITYLDAAADRTELLRGTSGDVLGAFRSAAKQWTGLDVSEPAKRAAQEFEWLNTHRSDFVHACPITSPSGDQILHRRWDAKGKYFEITEDFLTNFTSRLTQVTDALYEIRAIIRPDL